MLKKLGKIRETQTFPVKSIIIKASVFACFCLMQVYSLALLTGSIVTLMLVVPCKVFVRLCNSNPCAGVTLVMVILQPYIGDMLF